MQDTILGMTSTSQADFETWWSKQVATKFNLDEATIQALYGSDDAHNTQWRIREMWKYATAKGVNATPTVFVNGVHLDNVPFTVDDWMSFLNETYDSQWHPSPGPDPTPTPTPPTPPSPTTGTCPVVEGSMTYWCQEVDGSAGNPCIAGSVATEYTCDDDSHVCCHHYCLGEACEETPFLQ